MRRWGLVVAIVAAAALGGVACAGTTEVIVKVEDQQGRPVGGAHVKGLYSKTTYKWQGVTDEQGVTRLVFPDYSDTKLVIEKEGYYRTETREGHLVYLGGEDPVRVTYRLREKRNPIPLYKKRFEKKIPVKGEKVGIDFREGDWVAPYGAGDTPHMYVKFSGWAEGDWTYEKRLDISFPNPGDGIQEVLHEPGKNSEMRLPYKAPTRGYRDHWVLRTRRIAVGDGGTSKAKVNIRYENDKKWFGYFLRVNSERNEEGEVTKANYAKIVHEIEFKIDRSEEGEASINEGPMGEPEELEFTYYHNPTTNDRNLEFAEGANLLDEGAQ